MPRSRRAGARPPPWAYGDGARGPAPRDHVNRAAPRHVRARRRPRGGGASRARTSPSPARDPRLSAFQSGRNRLFKGQRGRQRRGARAPLGAGARSRRGIGTRLPDCLTGDPSARRRQHAIPRMDLSRALKCCPFWSPPRDGEFGLTPSWRRSRGPFYPLQSPPTCPSIFSLKRNAPHIC